MLAQSVPVRVVEGIDIGGEHTVAEGPDDFEAWVEPHLVSMGRLAARLVGPGSGDDVLQEALTRAWRRRSTYDASRGTPKTWLLAIVAGEASRWKWKRRRRSRRAMDTDVRQLDQTDVRIDIEGAIRHLTSRQQLAIALHYFIDLDIATCAGIMGCSEGTVKSTLHDARERLRTSIEVDNTWI